ncbi:flagellar hook-basal body complex protein FliE [Gottschalkia purinilytica]|uniref:Flagellar hook-basal body complex protein FliE n=1 Tax=Gottschalkia purinilytica TaxID=1503 RepID=A0A0L0WBB2_GOTPU|nr:flagellar hook-basal body complex protein FliE [Gottschalkia purinilytica]KNF08809.1 flagellar hook-basal body complex protein FliE [Gottschalkia purinilytica]
MKVNNIINDFGNINSKSNVTQGNTDINFSDYLKQALDKVNDLQLEADNQNLLLATGQVENIHDVTIASEKAKIALDLTMAVRNKVVDAYREIMRMQI